ncbi:hypothetical protein QJQ45_023060 [Haematococcus lacustris]|nr:hypothetical protein QJQ45_023060 [Haematococcus lacustris]
MGGTSSRMASEDDDAQEGPLGAIELKYRDNGASIVSLSSVSQTSVHFHNHTPWDVELLWVNYKSEPISYGTIPVGYSKLMHTYHTHPWCFRVPGSSQATRFLTLRDTQQQVVFPCKKASNAHLVVAPNLPWSLKTADLFRNRHRKFAAQARALLLAHHRLKSSPKAVSAEEQETNFATRPSGSPCFSSASSVVCSSPPSSLNMPRCLSPRSSFPSTTQRQPESEPVVVKCTDCYRAASQLLNGFSNTSGEAALRQVMLLVAAERLCSGMFHKTDLDVPLSYPAGSQTNLGDLPLDLVLCIVQHLAPNEPDVRPCESRDLVLPPSELLAAHEAAAAQIRAQLAQAAAAGAVPVIPAQAGPAAELAAAQAAVPHMEGGTATVMQTVVSMTSLPL